MFSRRNAGHLGLTVFLLGISVLEVSITNHLNDASGSLILKPASAHFQILWWSVDIATFTAVALVWVVLVLLSLVAIAVMYVAERSNQVLLPPLNHAKAYGAVLFVTVLLSFYDPMAHLRGFFAAQQIPEVRIDEPKDIVLQNKRLFLLGQNNDVYALLTAKQPEDKREIFFVKKDRYPILSIGNKISVLQPIRPPTNQRH
jgi:hypothetical protein